MKKYLKSFICCLMSAVMALSSALPAFASNDVTPVIMIHGMGGSALYKNPGTDEEEALPGFDITSLLGTGGLLSQLVSASRGEDVDVDDIIDKLADFMSPYQFIACDENGNSTDNIGINCYWTDSLAYHQDYLDSRSSNEPAIYKQICERVGAENVYAFNYDWRLDACENAKLLSSFIDVIKSQTGKSKVTIVSGSEGTVVAAAYIDAYKSKNDIKRVVFLNGALNGVNVTKAFKQDVVFDKEVVVNYLKAICVTYNNRDYDLSSLKILAYLFENSIENLCSFLNEIVDNPALLNKVYNEVLYPLGTIPALWEFIPYDDFDASVSRMNSIGFLDKSSGLYSKIAHYHQVQGRLESNLKELKNKGVEIAIVANYGTPAIPVTSAYAKQTDILIDTELASVGATVADFGKVLNKSGNYVSADKVIDASTCLFPDNTWFIKGIQHMDFWYDSEATEFVATLAIASGPVNIDSIEEETGIGQFIGTDKQQNIVEVTDDRAALGIYDTSANNTGTETVKKSPLTGNSFSTASVLAALSAAALSVFLFAVLTDKRKRGQY